MNVQEFFQSTAGKVVAGVLLVAAVGVAIFQFGQSGDSGKSRDVPKSEIVKEAEAQIAAIQKMTNLTDAEKKSQISHEQGVIDAATKGASKPPAPPSAGS